MRRSLFFSLVSLATVSAIVSCAPTYEYVTPPLKEYDAPYLTATGTEYAALRASGAYPHIVQIVADCHALRDAVRVNQKPVLKPALP